MEKMYIEMNDSERLLKRIYNDADWAFSMLSEGVEHMMDDSVEGTTVEEVNRLQNKATDALIEFGASINALLALLKSEEDMRRVIARLDNGMEDLTNGI